MNKEKIKNQIKELKNKVQELENELERDNFIPCTKEELLKRATAGTGEDHLLCGYAIGEVVIDNHIRMTACDHWVSNTLVYHHNRGDLSINVVLYKDGNKYCGTYVNGGIILEDNNNG